MGGRGGSSGMGGAKPVSKMSAKIFYNSAKKSTALRSNYVVERDKAIEKAIRQGDTSFIQSINSKKEAERVSDYLQVRKDESNRTLAKLGSAEAVYKNQRAAIEHRNITHMSVAMQDKMHEFSKRPEPVDRTLFHSKTTTTYDRWYKRQKANFEAWWNGSSKK